ncbi:MAG: SUMF1/EgtB/PvdO family nonheme iron enzyme [Bacteroidales bacterium]|nr:SUMF1/EgtB/PvdO family nonheme iron enzyme [Bacteroidales bacterium]
MKYILANIIAISIILILKTGGLTQDTLPDTPQPNQPNSVTVNPMLSYFINYKTPVFSFILNDSLVFASKFTIKDTIFEIFTSGSDTLVCMMVKDTLQKEALRYYIDFTNISSDTMILENVVPFGQTEENIYIAGSGPWALARTYLFRPGKEPIGVILPDNAWEMGYGALQSKGSSNICAITRRTDVVNAKKERYITAIYPGGSVNYNYYIESYTGEWQNGLKKMFREKYLFDLEKFDNKLYQRKDLQWIKDQYLIVLQFAWNHEFYDIYNDGYHIQNFLQKDSGLIGKYDIFGIWPTWPTLGVDERNQWDLYRDLPGGLDKLKEISGFCQGNDMRFFIAYNPWDQSTRQEDPYEGMADLIEATGADGVVLDTRGSSSIELQQAADSVKPGVIMYSEGMAITKDMPGIISGRVHDAIYMPPPLNLNRLIQPDFSIFRVCQLSQGRIHREVAISLFNGYGIEINTFAPGRPEWIPEEMAYLGKALKILREHSSVLKSNAWTPLIPTREDNIWVNRFPGKDKTVYTVYSLIPEGFNGLLFSVEPDNKMHYVSVWHHEEIKPVEMDKKFYVTVQTDAFNRSYLNSRSEGSVDCIVAYQNLIETDLSNTQLSFEAKSGEEIRLWKGDPSYGNSFKTYKPGKHIVNLFDTFGQYEGKIVIQLMKGNEVMDERVLHLEPGIPRLISKIEKTAPPEKLPKGMVEIPAGKIILNLESTDNFIPYPTYNPADSIALPAFYMDKYPVTNNQFYEFIESTGYKPSDAANFLKQWKEGKYQRGTENNPVVYVSLEDAQSYCAWAGKRLPTETEWQHAAQGADGRLYPWGNEMDSTKCNYNKGQLTSVIDYPEGSSPFGVYDLVGNVWQLTNDVYDNGSYYFIIMRGGSYYNPTSSWWYVKGGPQPLNKTQMLLRVSPGFERNATVGFRCMMDGI